MTIISLLLAASALASAQEPSGPLVLTGGTIIDGTGAQPKPNMTLVITGELITKVFPDGSQPLPAGARLRDARGQFIIPGLMDAHAHLGAMAVPNGVTRRILRGGVTTIRNMVGNCQQLGGWHRQAVTGEIDAPDIYYSAVTAGRGTQADPRATGQAPNAAGRRGGRGPGTGPGCGHIITDTTSVERVVSTSKGVGATGMKLYADLSAAVLKRIVDEAHRQGMVTWAHAAVFPAKPSDVVNAGVDVLSHAAYLAWETVDSLPSYRMRVRGAPFLHASATDPRVEKVLRDMATRGAILDATLFLFHQHSTSDAPSPNEDFQVGRDTLVAAAKWAYAVTRRARELGVMVSAGTDAVGAQGDAGPNLHGELEILVQESGFTPLEAIRSATQIAAKTMRIDPVVGTIAEGKRADLVVLRSDPSQDIRRTRDIAFVVKRGRIVQ